MTIDKNNPNHKDMNPSAEDAHDPTRRSILKTAGTLAVVATVGLPAFARAQPSRLNVTCWGGVYEDAIRTAFAEPFTKETGIEVNLVNNADLSRMKAQVDSRNVSWDVFDSVGPQIMSGSHQGLWETIDTSIVDKSGAIQETGADHVGTYFYSGGIGYDPSRHPGGKHPGTFAEFWDLETFPGRRGLRSRVNENLEMALLADGVSPDALYPLDVDRAFRAMDRIKPAIRTWIQTTPETVSLITRNEVDFTYTYMSRVFAAQRAGTSIDMSLAQTLNSLEYLAVPKYGKNTRAAMQYVAFCLRPDRQAAFCEMVEFSPNTAAAMDQISAAARERMPNMDDPNSIIINDAWWGENYEALQRRFTEWMML